MTIKPASLNPDFIRNHLANERTYLAWMRSAIALLGFGVAIVRLGLFRVNLPYTPSHGLRVGFLFALVGLIAIGLSVPHYFSVRDQIEADTYQPPDRLVFFFSSVVTFLGGVMIYYFFSIPYKWSSLIIFD